MMKRPIVQEDIAGCGIACAAFILELNYQKVIRFFENGKERAIKKGFFCSEIVRVLNKNGKKYECRHVNSRVQKKIYNEGVIVFIARSPEYPRGHYLCRTQKRWMDSWINFPRIQPVKAGFRKRLPGRPTYAILPITKSFGD